MGDRYGRSIWEIDMGDRYGRSDVNDISIGISIWDIGYRFGIWYIDMVVYHVDMVILDIDMGYGLMIWEMTVPLRSSSISIWDILSLCLGGGLAEQRHRFHVVALNAVAFAVSHLQGRVGHVYFSLRNCTPCLHEPTGSIT
jgi:hypothetical protein